MGGRGGVCRDDLAFRLFVSDAAILGAILGVSAGAGTVAGSDAVVAGGLGAGLGNNSSWSSLARLDVQIAVAVGWD